MSREILAFLDIRLVSSGLQQISLTVVWRQSSLQSFKFDI